MLRELLADDIRALGYEVDEVQPRVYAVKNFLTDAEVQTLLEEVRSYSEEHWRHRYIEEMKRSCLEKFGRDDIEALVEEGLLEVTWDFADKNCEYLNKDFAETIRRRAQELLDPAGDIELNGFLVVHRQYEGTELKEHYDQYSDKLIEYAAILYINDDYVDGELFFSKLGFEIRPEPGTLMVFPGTEPYTHGVRVTGPGPVRYNLPTFAKRLDPGGTMAGWANFG